MRQLLIEAIQDRRKLIVRGTETEMTVEPHAFGHDARGLPVLLCYEVGGGAASDQGWRLLPLNRGLAIIDAGEHFTGARPGYRRGAGDLSEAVACL